jgi:hypothetical protein
MIKEFLMKTMLKRQLKNLPPAEQERIGGMIEKNPQLFTKIAQDIEKRVKGGMSQHEAMMSVMKANQDELRKIMS